MQSFRSALRPFAPLFLLCLMLTGLLPSLAHAQTALPPGGSVTDTFSDTDTSKSYTFTVTADTDAAIKITNTAGVSTALYFLDFNNSTQITSVSVDAGKSDSVTLPHLGPGATYYIAVYRTGGSGSYTLSSTLSNAAGANDTEPNDDQNHPLTLPLNGSAAGHLGYSRASYSDQDPTDWYKVTTNADGDLSVAVTNSSGLSTGLYLYDVNAGSQLASVSIAPGKSESVSIAHTGPNETYYLQVYRTGGYGAYTVSDVQTPAVSVNDTEPNDDAVHANVLPLNGSASGRLGYSRNNYNTVDPTDWYKVTTNADGDLSVSVTNSAGVNTGLYLYDVNAASTLTSVNIAPGKSGSVSIAHVGPNQTYYLQVYLNGGYGAYTVGSKLTPFAGVNDSEPNDTSAQANPLLINVPVSGRLGFSRATYNTVDPTDWYKITVPRDGSLRLSVSTDSNLNAGLYFYDVGPGGQLGSVNIVPGGKDGFTIEHLGPGATYYMQVYLNGGYGAYTLKATFLPDDSPNDAENNDTLATAVPMTAPLVRVGGHLGYSRSSYGETDGADFYKVTAKAGNFDAYIIESAALRADLYLYDSNGSQLFNTPVDPTGKAHLAYNIPADGNYYLLVYRTGGYGNYIINDTPIATLTGTIVLDSLVADAAPQSVALKFHPHDNSGDFTRTVAVDFVGAYTIVGLPLTTYDLSIKGAKWLRADLADIAVTSAGATGVNTFLPGGDATNDNIVDIGDFGALVNAYNGDVTVPGSGYDVTADFNGDGVVDIADFGILVNNYNLTGDP